MNFISRREFLRRSSLLAGGGSLVPLNRLIASPAEYAELPVQDIKPLELAGRALRTTPIYARPGVDSPVISHLAADSVTAMTTDSLGASWYAVPGGFVPRRAIQPILAYARPAVRDEIGDGFWAEVIAPVSTVREWCYVHAPVVARLGFGAVVFVMDRIVTDDGQPWYGLSREPGAPLAGWASALHVAEWTPPTPAAPRPVNPIVQISLSEQKMSVCEGGKVLVSFPVYASEMSRSRGMANHLRAVIPGSARSTDLALGVPWLMRLDDGTAVRGAFWHNEFGLKADNGQFHNDSATAMIELTTFESRWLYAWLFQVGAPVRTYIG